MQRRRERNVVSPPSSSKAVIPVIVSIVAGIVTFPCSAVGQAMAVGGEFQVNTYITGGQRSPAVAAGADGAFVVVWQSAGSSGTDTSSESIQGQRYDAMGIPLGPEFQVNTYITNAQRNPAVAVDSNGIFVVVWQSVGSSGSDTSFESIQGRRYDAMGIPLGPEFQVNTYITNAQWNPAVAVDSDGAFVVVWQSYGSTGTDTSSHSIQGQRYDAMGIPLGDEFQVNTYITDAQLEPAVAVDSDGAFVVVWQSDGSTGTDTSYSSIQGQRYDALGTPLGAEFQVNTYTNDRQQRPTVAVDPGGAFVVVWDSLGSRGTDTFLYSIQGQRYDSTGASLGAEFQVNTYTTGGQLNSAAAIDPDGDFVVVWMSFPSSSGFGIEAQRFDALGTFLGAEFQANTYTTSDQGRPAVAVDADGDFVVVWDSDGSSGADTSYASVQGQRFRVTSDVGDRVFLDRDFDGVQDPTETGLEGIPVHLFDPLVTTSPLRSTTTDASGLYRFQPKPGEYFLQFELPSVYSFTPQDRGGDDSVDSDADVFTGETDTFTVSLFSVDLDWDAGMSNGIGDRVWLDTDGDGFQDGGELGRSGVTVQLRTGPGPSGLVDSTLTDGEGRYSFVELVPGLYYLEVVAPSGFLFTLQDAGPDESLDSDVDPLSGTTPSFELAPGDLDLRWDAGLIPEPPVLPAKIGDRVWLDTDGDGFQDGGELGTSGVTVQLRTGPGPSGLVDSTLTDGEGRYSFVELVPGLYYLEVVAPSGFLFTLQDAGPDESLDSDVDPLSGTTPSFELAPGDLDLRWDAGLIPEPPVLPAKIGDRVWLDTDSNGIQDGGEPGVGGIEVRLFLASGTVVASTVTDAGGEFAFDVTGGSYYLEIPRPAAFFTVRDRGLDDARDSDTNAVTGTTVVFDVEDGASALEWDTGFVPLLGDRVWDDRNGDGVQQNGEAGLPGVTVRLFDDLDQLVASQVTTVEGRFAFVGLGTGTYRFEVVPPAGMDYTVVNQGSNEASDSDLDPATGRATVFYVAAAFLDTVDVGLQSIVFADGFESGDLSAWSP